MEKYKPSYLGKAIPVDDQEKLTDFCNNKYESFSKIYDTVKDQSEEINDINTVDTSSNDSSELSIQVSAPMEVLENIKTSTEGDDSVNMSGDTITAKS